MKKIILVFMLIAFAVCSYGAEYEMVMFKCGIKGGKNIPNVSQALEKECHSAFMAYDDNYTYVFAIIDSTKNTTWLAVSNALLPLSKEEELKYASLKLTVETELEYVNGVKPRPTMDMTGALK